jgi:hypothetical protein
MQQHRVVRLHRVHRVDQKVCGHAFQERRGSDIRGHTCWQLRDEFGWCNAVFSVGPHGIRGGHPVSHLQSGHPGAHGFDGAGDLGAEHERQLVRIQPRSKVGIDEVHADRLGFDQYLTDAGGRL